MPPMRAASARLIPSKTAANDKSRRLWLASFETAARRRSSEAEKSVLIVTVAGMARILPAPTNQITQKKGIPYRVRQEGPWYNLPLLARYWRPTVALEL